tara:strand:+ start:1931 stop:2353 length:423 start_codon:yes stop_codon:yes gene_type:complete
MEPKLITGKKYTDQRGNLFYNNDFNTSLIKRIYYIENKSVEVIRGWQGHKVEQRWFNVVQGSFNIKLIQIDNWDSPSKKLCCKEFIISNRLLDVLHVPNGYVSCIQALQEKSKLLVMSDFMLGEINDDFRFDLSYFECIN